MSRGNTNSAWDMYPSKKACKNKDSVSSKKQFSLDLTPSINKQQPLIKSVAVQTEPT